MNFNQCIVRALPYFPKSLVGFISKRYIAGDNLALAVAKTKEINQKGASATIDYLGEFITEISKVEEMVETYTKTLDAIHDNKLDSTISLKPTSFGYLIDKDVCYQSIYRIVKKAKEYNNLVTIDMENHPLTDFTLDIYEKLKKEFPHHIGTVIQACLKRTWEDAQKISQSHPNYLRLCKGIYVEPETIAYQKTSEIHDSYIKTLDTLFSQKAYVGIATHNNDLIARSLDLIEKHKLSKDQYEFQMLLGVRPALLQKLLKQGHKVRVYVPFGTDWYAYSLRRLKENPSIAGNVMKDLLKIDKL
ncbi:MAG: proline dehydrogenase family protein [Candidatus Brocadiae bacterium]|nr:proline dehydrogenase family protein [Candidatus Brocadiia bacterium]